MSLEPAVVDGSLVFKGLLEELCYESLREFVLALPSIFGVQVPKSVTNVIFSNTQPLDSDRDSLWVRQDNAGKILGFYVFSNGTWRQMLPTPNGVFNMYGDSRDVPEGYVLADENNTALPPGVGLFLKTYWKLDPTNTYYIYFQATYSGL